MSERTDSQRGELRKHGWMLFVFVGVLLLLLGFVGFTALENRKGARALAEAIAALEAAGETVDPDVFAAGRLAVRDEENWWEVPVLKASGWVAFDTGFDNLDEEEIRTSMEVARKGGLGYYRRGFASKGEPISSDESVGDAEALLLYLAKDKALWDELAAELDRPYAVRKDLLKGLHAGTLEELYQSKLDFEGIKDALAVLSLRARASASIGEARGAAESLLMGLRLTEGHADAGLIGALLEAATAAGFVEAIWEVLESGVLGEAELRALAGRLEAQDLEEAALRGMRRELLFFVATNRLLKEAPPSVLAENLSFSFNLRPEILGPLAKLVPDGWYDQNAALMTRTMLSEVFLPLRSGRLTEASLPVDAGGSRVGPSNFLYRMSAPTIDKVCAMVARSQTSISLARIACLLEIHKRETGAYPETLDELKAELPLDLYLPKGATERQPYHYATTSNGRYKIWSIGENLTDEGGWGELIPGSKDPELGSGGDRVWAYRLEDIVREEP